MNTELSIVQLVELGLILLVGFAILSALGVYAMRQMQSRRPRAASVEGYPDRPSMHFQGRGTMTVTADGLVESTYRIDYRLPADVLVKIELIERATGNNEVILVKSGEGIEGFAVPHAGDYLLRIEPLTDDAAWSFEIRPVGPKPAL